MEFRLKVVRRGRLGRVDPAARGRQMGVDQLLKILRGMSEEDQNTFHASHGAAWRSSMEGDTPQFCVRVEDPAVSLKF